MHETCLAGLWIFALGCQLTVPPEKAPISEDAQVDVGTPDARARTAPATWQDAENDCKSIGAHLLVIGDLHENIQLDMAFNGSAYWIGYTDAVTEGLFQWVNGSSAPFQRFITGVPNNDAEDCIALLDGGAWVDQPCDMALPYACECDPLPP